MTSKVTPIRSPQQTELLDALEATAKELLMVLELDIAYQTEHFTDDTAKVLSRARLLLLKHGREICALCH